MDFIEWKDFEKIIMVAGTIIRVEDFPEARKPAYKVWVNFGAYGEKKSSAQIVSLYTKEELIGKQIIGILNFPEKQIGPFRSQFLLTGFETDQGVVISTIERPIPNGTKIS